MAAGGVDVSRRSVVVGHAKRDYECYRNGSNDLYSSQSGRHGEGRQIKRSYEHDRKRKDGCRDSCNGSGLVSERGEASAEKVQQPLEKRRKYSPIVWDVEDRVKVQARKTVNLSSTTPSSPKSGISCEVLDGDARREISSEHQINVKVSSDSPAGMEPVKEHMSIQDPIDDLEEGQLEEEFHAPNIAKSRWASGLDSQKEAFVCDVEKAPKTSRWNRTSLTPESGEFLLEESDKQRSLSSGCSGGRLIAERLSDHGLEGRSNMDVDEAQCYCSDFNQSDKEEPASPGEGSTNMLLGSRNVDEYEKLNKISEGTYGVVYRARDKKTGEIVALKKIKMNIGREDEYGFPVTSLREINILLSCNHPSIVNVKEVVVGSSDSVFMVMEHLEHDIRGLMDRMKQPFSTSEVKCLMIQLLEGVKYLHSNWIIHRDLKPSNLLMNNSGELKICDFGMARLYGSPLKPYTQLVVTQWYRAPELLLGAKKYSTAVDMWSVGCIMAELLSRNPLFQGKGGSDIDQLRKIFAVLGTPSEAIWPGFSSLPGAKANFVKQPYNLLRKKFPAASFTGSPVLSDLGFDLLNRLLSFDPEKRLTVNEALNHDWFREVPLPKSKDFMPTFPPKRG